MAITMTGVTVPELLANLAPYLATVPGIGSAYDTPPATLEGADLPAIVLFWGGDEDTVVNYQQGRQQWLPAIKGQLFGAAAQGETPEEFAVAYGLLTPIVDALRAGSPNDLMPGLTAHVDHIRVTRLRPSLMLGYAGHDYYGAEFFLDVKVYRYPQRGTP